MGTGRLARLWPPVALLASYSVACGSRSLLRETLQQTDGGGGASSATSTSRSTRSGTNSTRGQSNAVATVTLGATSGSGGNGGNGGSGGTGGAGGVGGSPEIPKRPFLDEFGARVPPEFSDGPAPPAPDDTLPEVQIYVDESRPIRLVPRTLFGNNAAVWQGDLLLSDLMQKRLGDVNVSVLRFPGGSTSDTYHFDGDYPPYAEAQGWDVMSEDWAVSTAEYMQVVRALNAVPLITVNHGFASYLEAAADGSVGNAARLAANWVEYCNAPNDGSNENGGVDYARLRAEHGSSEPFAVRYWEVGNETYGSWEVGFEPEGSDYAENFNEIADAMREVDPDIFIGLVTPADQEYILWTEAVLSNPGTFERADFLVVHNYFGWISDESQLEPGSMLARTSQVGEYKERLASMVESATGRDAANVPMYFGEYNLPLPTHQYQLAHISGLFIADVLGQLAKSGWAAASLWDVANDFDEGSGLGAGDHGFLSRNQPNLPDLTPRPSYYPFFFFTEHYGDVVIEAPTSSEYVAAHASVWPDHTLGIVFVNKSSEDIALRLYLDTEASAYRSNLWYLTADSVDDPRVYLNGVSSGEVAGGPDPTDVEPYAQRFEGDTPRIRLPGYSLVSLVLWPE